MLLPMHSAVVAIEEQDDGVIARAGVRWYRFPREDVALLPIPNTTVEPMARYLCGRLREELLARADAQHLTALEVELEETFGQSAVYREVLR
jgi:6-pyruvoyltetrahydropterin/6-carboxytetrahydropterin synthase